MGQNTFLSMTFYKSLWYLSVDELRGDVDKFQNNVLMVKKISQAQLLCSNLYSFVGRN